MAKKKNEIIHEWIVGTYLYQCIRFNLFHFKYNYWFFFRLSVNVSAYQVVLGVLAIKRDTS